MANATIRINRALDAPEAGIIPRTGTVTFSRLTEVTRVKSSVSWRVSPQRLKTTLTNGTGLIVLEVGLYRVELDWATSYITSVTADALEHELPRLDPKSLEPGVGVIPAWEALRTAVLDAVDDVANDRLDTLGYRTDARQARDDARGARDEAEIYAAAAEAANEAFTGIFWTEDGIPFFVVTPTSQIQLGAGGVPYLTL